jgi:uncharacterized protein YcfJ
MKKVAIAVASLFTAVAPAAFGQASPWYGPSYDTIEERDRAVRQNERKIRRAEREARFDEDRFARVIETRPLHDATEARTECWNPQTGLYEEVREENKHRIGKGAAIGAIAGGVLGHQFDQGGGTAAGAILGGLLGHHIEGRRDRDDQSHLDMGRCRTLAQSGPTRGYEVRYEYQGQEYVTRMDHDPGRRLRVGEDIAWDGTPRDAHVAYSTPSYNWR